MKLNNYPELIQRGKQFAQNRLLFDFEFVEIKFKCVLFIETNTILFSIVSQNIGYLISLDTEGNFNGKLPSEVYYSVREKIVEKTKIDNITQLWNAFDDTIGRLNILDIKEISEDEILGLIRTTKTADKKYDIEGEKPFFETWRRNRTRRNVSSENLFKTEKYFGREISKICRINNISSIWKEMPTGKSLDFMNLEKVKNEINI